MQIGSIIGLRKESLVALKDGPPQARLVRPASPVALMAWWLGLHRPRLENPGCGNRLACATVSSCARMDSEGWGM